MRDNPPEPIRVLVVDDEAPARRRLIEQLLLDAGIGDIDEASDGRMAVERICSQHPDLVFLDMQMPELTGLEVIRAIGAEALPLTIFVTAYDQHAVAAFEANALDYLLKPFSDERLEAALTRARARLADRKMRAFGHGVINLLSVGIAGSGPGAAPNTVDRPVIKVSGSASAEVDRLVVKTGSTMRFVRLPDIDWIEAAGVYVTLHVDGAQLLYRSSLTELCGRLNARRFVRVHRSVVVNIDSIVQLERVSHGEFEVILRGGRRTRVSRTYSANLERRLGQPL